MPLYPLPVILCLALLGLVIAVSLVDDPEALIYAGIVMGAGSLVCRRVAPRRSEVVPRGSIP